MLPGRSFTPEKCESAECTQHQGCSFPLLRKETHSQNQWPSHPQWIAVRSRARCHRWEKSLSETRRGDTVSPFSYPQLIVILIELNNPGKWHPMLWVSNQIKINHSPQQERDTIDTSGHRGSVHHCTQWCLSPGDAGSHVWICYSLGPSTCLSREVRISRFWL